MGHQEDPNFRLIAILLTFGVLSVLGVSFAGSLFFQRKQNDAFFASNDYRVFQERLAVNNIRQSIAEEFALAVVNCLSPPIAPGQSLTEQQIAERVTAAFEITSQPQGTKAAQNCENSRSSHWTFVAPCKLKISESFSKLNSGLNFGEIGICETAIVKALFAASHSCTQSADFQACLAKAIPASSEIKYEIEKPVEAVR
jgi:hypothetical protein